MARLFVAAWPPADVVATLAALPRPSRDRVRWTTADQWHVTLRFLGETAPADAEAALATVVAAPAEAVLGPAVQRFGSGYLAVPVAGVDAVAAAVTRATAAVGERPDDRAFRGHLTVARVRDGARVTGLTGAPFAAHFPVTEVALVASELHPDGARYRTIATVALAAAAA